MTAVRVGTPRGSLPQQRTAPGRGEATSTSPGVWLSRPVRGAM